MGAKHPRNMFRTSVGTRLYVSVLSVFILFAAAFILFQHTREREYKINSLNTRLQDYNSRLTETLEYMGDHSEKALDQYIRTHHMHGLRVTLVKRNGQVVYDNLYKNYAKMDSHKNREEVREAFTNGSGHDFSRRSSTMNQTYFYSATYVPELDLVVRSALPYDNSLAEVLKTDQHYLWFTLVAVLILVFILYRFVSRLGDNIAKLRLFASRADHNESLDTEDLVGFSGDELGEIAERIIKMYKRLKRTKEEQNVLKRQLTQNIAHELKTPVASIQGYLETVLETPNINEKTKQQFLERCYAQSQRLASLLHDISTLNRLDDAPEMVDFETVDINAMVADIMKATALQMSERKMTFDNRLPQGVSVRGNQSLLYSVFRNLTDNAIAYAGEGTTITLSASPENEYWSFTFSDNGIGVPYEHLPRLFERFYRVDKGRSRKMGGTGLGLAIVKNAVLLHGGTISVNNNITGGLRFPLTPYAPPGRTENKLKPYRPSLLIKQKAACMLQKTVFYIAKGHLPQCERRPYTTRITALRNTGRQPRHAGRLQIKTFFLQNKTQILFYYDSKTPLPHFTSVANDIFMTQQPTNTQRHAKTYKTSY